MLAQDSPGDSAAIERRRVFISYKRDAELDAAVASFLYEALTREGHDVFLDVEIPAGSNWSDLISNEIRNSDFFIVLLSKASAAPKGFVVAETVMAGESEAATGRPRILAVRLADTTELPLRLSAAIGHLHHLQWRKPDDNNTLLVNLLQAIGKEAGRTKPTALLRGEHFIITRSVWDKPDMRESIAGTKLVPVIAGQEAQLVVTRARGPALFGVRVLESGELEVAIWHGTPYRGVRSQPDAFIPLVEGDTHTWCFTRYQPNDCVLIRRLDSRKDPVAVTFDADVVRAVWTITHQRGTQRENFLLVMKEPSAN